MTNCGQDLRFVSIATTRVITVTLVAMVIAAFATPVVQARAEPQARHENALKNQKRDDEQVERRQHDQHHRHHASPAAEANQCAAAKLEASGRYVDDSLECLANAGTKDDKDADACLRKAGRTLTDTFARQERTSACTTTGEAATFKAFIDPAIADLVTSLGRPERSKCTKKKFSAAGEDAESKYECQARAVSQGAGFGLDPRCWAYAEEELADAFSRAELKGDCAAGAGDAQVIDDKIDALVGAARGVISPPASACTPMEVTTLHGDDFHGNTRLAKIENGTVPCLHVDDGTVAACRFSIASGHVSGDWLESPDGNFAKAGQALSLDGTPGGDYVVAARLSDTAGASCIEPTSLDTAGWVAPGTELAVTCKIEQMGMPWNAFINGSFVWSFDYYLNRIVNYTTREVCSADNPAEHTHPDFAEFVRTITGIDGKTAYCYTGPGAALNDINGTERDAAGNYMLGEQYCHMLVSSGYEVPGAKRPATRSLPAPGHVDTSSFLVWRPVNPNVTIANELPPNPPVQSFNDKAAFLAATGAVNASGELPNLGVIAGSARVGSVTISLAPGGNNVAIGAAGSPAAPDWYPNTPGNEIALGYENLQVSFDAPVYAMGFDMVEPNTTMPFFGGTPVDSTYQVTLFSGPTLVGKFTFNAPDDVPAFVGVESDMAFDRAWIIDVTTDAAGDPSPFIADDEYFGQFYTAATPAGAAAGRRSRQQ